MDTYSDLMSGSSPVVIVITAICVIGLIAWFVYNLIGHKVKSKQASEIVSDHELHERGVEVDKQPTKLDTMELDEKDSILETGHYKCICFRPGNIIDFTTIPRPIGELYQFDPSCPMSGSGYIVKQDSTGEIVDYDPRIVEYKLEESPEVAWFATNWEIVKTVYSLSLDWWRSRSVWFAAALLAMVFICGLVVFDI